MAALERGQQRRLINDATPGGVDQIRGWFHPFEARGAKHPDGLWRLGTVDGHEISTGERSLKIGDRLAAGRTYALGRQIRIIGQHSHVHGEAALGDPAADAAKSDYEHAL